MDSGALSRAFVDAAPNAILFVDEAKRIVLANPACDALFGYPPGTLLGRSVETLVPERFSDHVRLCGEYVTEPRPRPMGQGRDLVARHADGSEIPVDISLTPLVVGARHLVVCCVTRDLRGRSLDRVGLRVQSAALHFAASGIVITDHTGTIQWVNPAACAITGYAREELVGRHTRVFKSGEHGPELLRGSVAVDHRRQDVVGADRQSPQGRLPVPGGADHCSRPRRRRSGHPLRRDQTGRDRGAAYPG